MDGEIQAPRLITQVLTYQMPSYEGLEAELAIKTNLVEALNAENEQLRLLMQKHADAVDSKVSERLLASDMTRGSNEDELQTVITHMRTQLHETASNHDSATVTVAKLRKDNTILRATNSDIEDEMNAMKIKIQMLDAQLVEAIAKYDGERQKVLNLRTGMEESKRAISIMKDQLDRRASISNADTSRRASEIQNRKTSLVATSSVSEARRGSLNYLSGLGLTSKRLGHFDPRKQAMMEAETNNKAAAAPLNLRASLPASANKEISNNQSDSLMNKHRRASLPAAPADFDSAPASNLGLHVTKATHESPRFSTTSRRSSLTAGRRGSSNLDSPSRRNSVLAQTLLRMNAGAGQDEHDLPLTRREATTISEEDGSNLTALPETASRRRGSASLNDRRRSSVQLGSGTPRRGSENLLLRLTADLDNDVTMRAELASPAVQAAMLMNRTSSFPPNERNGLVQALSLEAAMEISSLKEIVAELKLQLLEADESREASEACARALRDFIASSASSEPEHIKLPPLPSDSDLELEAEAEAERQRKEKEKLEKQEKRSSRWGMPKLLPSLSYTSVRRDASNSIISHLPAAVVNKSPNPNQLTVPGSKMDPDGNLFDSVPITPKGNTASLKQPAWRTTANLRSSVASGTSDATSATPSPILATGVPNFQQSFSGFSFSARQARSVEELDEPSSPMGSRADSPTFEGSSSTDESEIESMPVTPLDASFGSRMDLNDGPLTKQGEQATFDRERKVVDPTMTPRAGHSF